MSEDKENLKHDDEYEYHDEREPENYIVEPLEKPRRSFLSRLFGKKIVILVILLVAIVVVYKFLGPVEKVVADQDDIQPNLSNVTPVNTTTTLPSATTPVVPAVAPQATAPTSDTLNQLTQQAQNQADVIKQLQTNLAQMNDSLSQMQSAYNNLNDSVTSLTNQIQQLQAKEQKPIVKKIKYKPVPRYTYYLKAVVPGRAWLESTTGYATTVKVGDRLQGYGTVTAINANQGWVATSSGIVIQYGPLDS